MRRKAASPPRRGRVWMGHVDYKAIVVRQKAELEAIYQTLRQGGFAFEHPNEAWRESSPRTEELLVSFAAQGCVVPEAVAEFYRQIGGVNFIGWSSDWDDDEYPDALTVWPLEWVVENLNQEYREPEDRAAMQAAYGGFYFAFCPDFLHKQNISGGEAYGFTLPTSEADPKVNGIPWDLRFTEYIDLAIETGGFPGIDFWKHRMKEAQDFEQGESGTA